MSTKKERDIERFKEQLREASDPLSRAKNLTIAKRFARLMTFPNRIFYLGNILSGDGDVQLIKKKLNNSNLHDYNKWCLPDKLDIINYLDNKYIYKQTEWSDNEEYDIIGERWVKAVIDLLEKDDNLANVYKNRLKLGRHKYNDGVEFNVIQLLLKYSDKNGDLYSYIMLEMLL